MNSQLVLATASRYRIELLARLGIAFDAFDHRCDERGSECDGLGPDQLAARLSIAKAESLRAAYPGAYILGSDQVVDLAGTVLGKPETAPRAVDQLMRLQGATHRLLTGVALVEPDGKVTSAMDVHVMRMRAMTRGEAEVYVARERPLDCAGSYKIEGLGICLFDSIEGADFTAISGLPLIAVAKMLRAVGFDPLAQG
jgi:septum formation protein